MSAPDPLLGHVRVLDLPSLAELGRRTGGRVWLQDADGAWLVLDRAATEHPPTHPGR